MFYFTPFPTKKYSFKGISSPIDATDITRRFSISSFLSSSKVVFDEYFLQEGDRPDTVAYDYYDDTRLDWLVLLTNEIKDPYFEWPLGYDQFNSYIIKKYGSVSVAAQTIHHYEWIVQQENEYVSNYETIVIPEKTIEVDYTTYAALTVPKRRSVSVLDYETNLNEYRRKIFLLDVNLVDQVKDQHPKIFDTENFVR